MMRNFLLLLGFALGSGLPAAFAAKEKPAPAPAPMVIYHAVEAKPLEILAAREIQRYVYLRSGSLLPIKPVSSLTPASQARGCIVVAQKDRPLWKAMKVEDSIRSTMDALQPQQYCLKTMPFGQGRALWLVGGDETATLYAAYHFAEKLGVRFYLHGDVVPEDRGLASGAVQKGAKPSQKSGHSPSAFELPFMDETAKPLFDLRGIQPFHDFPEGPDWWNQDDYLAILTQLPKLRMNFLGLHTYPEGGPNAEPTVWIGLPEDIDAGAKVKFSYPSSYQNTLRGNWGYAAKKTADFGFGSSLLFERDAFGSSEMVGFCPEPATPAGSSELFQRAGDLLANSFRYAHLLGIKTCVGTETPLTIPQKLQEHLKAKDKKPDDHATIQELYEGLFKRIMQTYPLDYYWFWTPEFWTWESVKEEQVRKTTNDLVMAIAAAKNVKAPFQLATCGWVLGPPGDRGMFDQFLPKDMPMSCINREVGKSPVEPGFARVKDRPKWAIPWLEDDPALTSPQLWVGRMRQDAVDALDYGCNGLLGIHWRTRALSANVSALAKAAWEQKSWRKTTGLTSGWLGGRDAQFPNTRFENAEDETVYHSVRYGMSLLRLVAPNGKYTVTLKFCEPVYEAAGKRVFGVKIQGKTVLDHFDIFAKVGKNRAVDFAYNDVEVTQGMLDIDFVQQVENPSIAAIIVAGAGYKQKINCGGKAWQDYAADLPALPRYQPTEDFFQDWAAQEFGPETGPIAARLLAKIDGNLPRPSDWNDGPGNLKPDARTLDDIDKEYAFVDEFAALSSKVKGAGYRERYEYWLNTFQYMRAMGRVNGAWGHFNKTMEAVRAEKDSAAKIVVAREKALPARRQIIQDLRGAYTHLLATVSNPGELGTIANWEQHIPVKMLKEPGEELVQATGAPLSADVMPPAGYQGPTRVIVPTVRTTVGQGEHLRLKVLVLSEQKPREAVICYRPMGRGTFEKIPLQHVARGVYTVLLPAFPEDCATFEFYVKVTPSRGKPVHFPATAPAQNQTVVVYPGKI